MTAKNWATLAILSILWGGSFLFIEVALTGFPVLTIVWARVAGAAAVLGLWLAVGGRGSRTVNRLGPRCWLWGS